ncbi:MAG: ribonuclease III [Anaerolineaceae bacterium 4572_78]|nr:MAG: ribonuclease III [Anaerolineaceae bacterium 4572_78]
MNIKKIEAKLEISFDDKNLLKQALTHSSYLNENVNYPLESNERLEFLGDATVGFLTATYLYQNFPEIQEGQLTSFRAALVRTEMLADFAIRLNLGQHLNMGKGEHENGGRERLTILCGAFESLIGAIYLDKGLEIAKYFFIPMIKPEIEKIIADKSYRDSKSLFQEMAQGYHKITPVYQDISETGPAHNKVFTVGVYIDKVCYGRGIGTSKQQAAQLAAQEALRRLEIEISIRPDRSLKTCQV